MSEYVPNGYYEDDEGNRIQVVDAIARKMASEAASAAAKSAAEAVKAAKEAKETLEAVVRTAESETEKSLNAIDNMKNASVTSVQTAAAQQEEAIAAKGQETLASIPEDYTAMQAAVQQNTADILLQAPAIVENAAGSMVSITDGAERPAVSLVSHIEPVQEGEGEPSPDNVRPISGWNSVMAQRTSRNLLPKAADKTMNGVTFTANDDGSVKITGTTTNSNTFCNIHKFKDASSYMGIPRGTYILSGGTSILKLQVLVNGKSLHINRGGDSTFTIPETATSSWLRIQIDAAGTEVNGTIYPMLRLATDTDATYAAPEQATLTADLPETVYGGTVDWGTGVLNVTHKHDVYDGSEDETWTTGLYNNAVIFVKDAALPANGDDMVIVACSCAKPISYNDRGASTTPHIHARINSEGGFDLRNMGEADEVRTQLALTPMHVVYKIATPYTLQLTPQQLETLKGSNNVWSDTGDTDLTYIVDTKLYIDKKIAAIAAATV